MPVERSRAESVSSPDQCDSPVPSPAFSRDPPPPPPTAVPQLDSPAQASSLSSSSPSTFQTAAEPEPSSSSSSSSSQPAAGTGPGTRSRAMSTFSGYMSSAVSFLRLPMIASSGLALILSGALYLRQNELVYPRDMPSGTRHQKMLPSEFNIRLWEELKVQTPDGETLSAYLIKAEKPRNVTVLMFHGNAGNISHRVPIAKVIAAKLGFHVLMLEYRGYGESTGSPGEKGIQIDAQAGLDYIKSRPDLKETNVVLYGQSLGGAVAIHLAAKNVDTGVIKAIVVENTFLSIRKMIPSAFPPARYVAMLCHEIWPSEESIKKIGNTPILFLSGSRDELVPPDHMTQLFDLCPSPHKTIRRFSRGHHNNTVEDPEYFHAFFRFLQGHRDILPGFSSSAAAAAAASGQSRSISSGQEQQGRAKTQPTESEAESTSASASASTDAGQPASSDKIADENAVPDGAGPSRRRVRTQGDESG